MSRIRYGGFADEYHNARAFYAESLIDWVITKTGIKPGGEVRIADIGAGTGLLSQAFAKRGFIVTLIDPDRDMLDRAIGDIDPLSGEWEGGFEEPVVGYANNTGFKEPTFDLILAGTMLHHAIAPPAGEASADNPDPVVQTKQWADAVAPHWNNILKPNGKVAAFYVIPSLSDPVVQAMHEALTGPEASEKYPNIAKAYNNPRYFIFNEWDRIDRFVGALVDDGPHVVFKRTVAPDRIIPRLSIGLKDGQTEDPDQKAAISTFFDKHWSDYTSQPGYKPVPESESGLRYAMESDKIDKDADIPTLDGQHPVHAVMDYLRTNSSTRDALLDHEKEAYDLVKDVMAAIPMDRVTLSEDGKPSLKWVSRVYLGFPRTRELTAEERHPPTPLSATGKFARGR